MSTLNGNASPSLIVFTDLDGTLLDHHNYSYAAALPGMQALKQRSIPLIIVTSKTLPEVLQLRRELGNDSPFIVENGAALALPKKHFDDATIDGLALDDDITLVQNAPPYETLCQLLHQWREEFSFPLQGFSDWTAEQVVENTGLDLRSAEMAKDRIGSEPFLWHGTDDDFEKLQTLSHEHGLRCVKGGRFYHLTGAVDKAGAVSMLLEFYRGKNDQVIETLALGDSPNDLSMLALADYAVVIRKPDTSHMSVDSSLNAYYTKGIGPEGWNEAILNLLNSQELANV